ncbi:unnamed protein product [Lepeophtheirus salmonis]|uniref:(salmon louse) hypothetical protein n=1 Tax=Lepeophtheirus salmonis TaxID=72036 RepID=A0A7R8H6B5_LEPSM|nr:unnamed protein product [Lepeophtheirus salmonis]CAF2885404.1 unnamed protein product [Lepeophtheirus salmonis]
MLNLFAAICHINYGKSARLYLQMMNDLPSTFPDLQEQFKKDGYHVVRRSDRFWKRFWTNLSIEGVYDLQSSLGNADTQIVSAALDYAKDSDKDVVVVAGETDILVLLMFHWRSGMHLYMLSDAPTKKRGQRMWRIEDLVISTGNVITGHILFIYALSGYDTTSALFGHESAKVFEDETATAEEVEQQGLELLIYGGKRNRLMEDLHYHQFMKAAAKSTTTIKPQSLAPTKNAAKFHFLRVHLQVIEWKTWMGVEVSPLNWGWKLSNNSYEPIMTDFSVAPDDMLRFIRCNCNVSNRSPCSTNVFSCRQHGLSSVSSCGNCNGVECDNCYIRRRQCWK